MTLARRGETAQAILCGEAAASENPADAGLRMFVGTLHARQSDLPRALIHLRVAASLLPADPLPRIEIARILTALGDVDEANRELSQIEAVGSITYEITRVRASINRRRGNHREAAIQYGEVLARDGRDFESWAGLGLSLMAAGNLIEAIDALRHSLALRPTQLGVRMHLAQAQVAAGVGEDALAAARIAAGKKLDPLLFITIARLEDLLGRPSRAEAALTDALALDAKCLPAMLALADLAERNNRIEELGALLTRLKAAQAPNDEIALLEARFAYRCGDYRSALDIARSSPASSNAGGRAHIIGEASDRLGDTVAAIAAFVEMNGVDAAGVADAHTAAATYRAMVDQRTSTLTEDWCANWQHFSPDDGREDPVFLVGFPRSGTTLLDTFLMGSPEAFVLEERPVLFEAYQGLVAFEELPVLGDQQIAKVRQRYFSGLDATFPDARNRVVIDKLPLGLVDTAIIHRIFPRARFIFAERHPCDVVLSCFMTRFDPRGPMANFLDVGDTGLLYDAVLRHWRRCREMLPLEVQNVRYERLIEDPRRELQPLGQFLGISLSAQMLDHQSTAKARNHIVTPSYAQVTEPLYTRGIARWERYGALLEKVMPSLGPSAEWMGYSLHGAPTAI